MNCEKTRNASVSFKVLQQRTGVGVSGAPLLRERAICTSISEKEDVVSYLARKILRECAVQTSVRERNLQRKIAVAIA